MTNQTVFALGMAFALSGRVSLDIASDIPMRNWCCCLGLFTHFQYPNTIYWAASTKLKIQSVISQGRRTFRTSDSDWFGRFTVHAPAATVQPSSRNRSPQARSFHPSVTSFSVKDLTWNRLHFLSWLSENDFALSHWQMFTTSTRVHPHQGVNRVYDLVVVDNRQRIL